MLSGEIVQNSSGDPKFLLGAFQVLTGGSGTVAFVVLVDGTGDDLIVGNPEAQVEIGPSALPQILQLGGYTEQFHEFLVVEETAAVDDILGAFFVCPILLRTSGEILRGDPAADILGSDVFFG